MGRDKAIEKALKNRAKLYPNKPDKISKQIEWIRSSFNGVVPRIPQKPQRSDYGLPDNAEQIIEQEKKRIEEQKKKDKAPKRNAIIIMVIIECLAFCYFSGESLAVCIVYLILGGLIFLFGLTSVVVGAAFELIDKKRHKSEIDRRIKYEDELKRYKRDMDAFDYWQAVQTLDYWNSLDGHAFERAVAAVYTSLGYEAAVSREGGDGGIDIVLKKNGERIAVQCKAHNNPVAPAVARDLYGTMVARGYSKGILVSKTGFTKGVYEFIGGKNIELVDLDDILKMQNQG